MNWPEEFSAPMIVITVLIIGCVALGIYTGIWSPLFGLAGGVGGSLAFIWLFKR